MLAAKTRRLLDPLDELKEYDDLFVFLPKPGIAKNYQSDESFGEQRLSGANPMAMRRIDRLPEAFPITDAHVRQALEAEHSVETELNEGRLVSSGVSPTRPRGRWRLSRSQEISP